MATDGFDFNGGRIGIYGGLPGAPALITFPSYIVAKGFFCKFSDYVWESEDGTQTVTVHLVNEQLRREVASVSSQIALANTPAVSPQMVMGISGAVATQ